MADPSSEEVEVVINGRNQLVFYVTESEMANAESEVVVELPAGTSEVQKNEKVIWNGKKTASQKLLDESATIEFLSI
jgi:hypothetical protein